MMMEKTTESTRYDRTTMVLHWLTAILVVVLFALALVWDELPRGTPLRKGLQSLHISLGLLLVVVFAVRVFWRRTRGRHLSPASVGLQQLVATLAHHALYLLLGLQIVLGFVFRWAQGEPFMFFGLFSIPSPIAADRSLAHNVGKLHDIVAWVIIVLASLHAAAALFHHFIVKDGVMRRMLPRKSL